MLYTVLIFQKWTHVVIQYSIDELVISTKINNRESVGISTDKCMVGLTRLREFTVHAQRQGLQALNTVEYKRARLAIE